MKNRVLCCTGMLALEALGGGARRTADGRTEHSSVTTVFHFDLPAPRTLKRPITLWATWYWTPSYTSQKQGIPLLDSHERPLGPRLPEEDFCHAAVQGSVRVDGRIYTFDTIGKRKLAPCERYRPDMPQAPYVRFRRSPTAFGEGTDDYNLIPYRSVAVDEKAIPVGTVLYIPQARGNHITLPDGRKVIHDGYFFAADDGYGVYGHHIDVFNGISKNNPFPWVQSEASATFKAYIITDPGIKGRLRRLHRGNVTDG